MTHGTPTEWQEEESQFFKTRVGLIMFAVFSPVYLAFILVAVISPKSMAMDIGSLNLAIVFGFGIIILAIIQALLYNYICSRREKMDGTGQKAEVGK